MASCAYPTRSASCCRCAWLAGALRIDASPPLSRLLPRFGRRGGGKKAPQGPLLSSRFPLRSLERAGGFEPPTPTSRVATHWEVLPDRTRLRLTARPRLNYARISFKNTNRFAKAKMLRFFAD